MDLGAQLSQLSPEQRQAIMIKAQQEANQSVMQEMMKEMITTCFDKCAGTSVGFFNSYDEFIHSFIPPKRSNRGAMDAAQCAVWPGTVERLIDSLVSRGLARQHFVLYAREFIEI